MAILEACDTHVHVIGSITEYPMLDARRYTPAAASLDQLQTHLHSMQCGRVVIVQPSFYGFDNRCTLDSVLRLNSAGRPARSILVLPLSVSDQELKRLDQQGARGVRINVESSGTVSSSIQSDIDLTRARLETWAARLAGLGWHLQLYARWPILTNLLDDLCALAVPVVLDHFAMLPLAQLADGDELYAGQARLARALKSGNLYVKLSASYRLTGSEAAIVPPASERTAQVCRLANSLLNSNPARILWGSDWPHTQHSQQSLVPSPVAHRPVRAQTLLDEAAAWLAEPQIRSQVLEQNPALLFGF